METLDIILRVAQIVLFLSLAAAAIYLIRAVNKISTSVENMEGQIDRTVNELTPVVNNLNALTADLKNITEQTKIHINKVGMLTDSVAAKGHELLDAVDKIQVKANYTLNNGMNFVSAVGKGISVFKKKISK